MTVIVTHKPAGMTLANLLQTFRDRYAEYAGQRITYAGRLDPMAQGLMILLSGPDVHRKEEFTGQDKTYEVSVLFGLSTDTYDALGLITKTSQKEVDQIKLKKLATGLVGKKTQAYPPYSSRTVNGTPLFSLAKSGKLKDMELPEKDIIIHHSKIESVKELGSNTIYRYVTGTIITIDGEFRQEEILSDWQKWKKDQVDKVFIQAILTINSSSGTYMRGLANELGEELGTGAIALKINRIKIGDLTLKNVTHPLL